MSVSIKRSSVPVTSTVSLQRSERRRIWAKRYTLFVTILMILLFGYTGIAKLIDYENFKFSLSESPYIWWMAPFLSWALPIGELGIVLMLLIPRFRRLGLWLSFILMALFTVYIGVMLAIAPDDMPCSCGGIFEEMSWGWHLVVNAGVTFSLIAIIKANHLLST